MRGRSKAGKISQGGLATGLVWGLDFVPCGLAEPTQECPHPHVVPPVARPDFVLAIPRTAFKQDSSLHGLSTAISQDACSRRGAFPFRELSPHLYGPLVCPHRALA